MHTGAGAWMAGDGFVFIAARLKVPEPASDALRLAGLGLPGAGVRRRRAH